jgi:hypothetical protein
VVVPQRGEEGIQAGVEDGGRAAVGGFLATDHRGDQALRVVDDRAAAFENQCRALITALESVSRSCQESTADGFGIFLDIRRGLFWRQVDALQGVALDGSPPPISR